MNRLRILHVLNRLALAGTEYGVVKQVNALDPGRFEPSICSFHLARPAAMVQVRAGVEVQEFRRRPGFDPVLLGALASLLRRRRIDVVHSHNWSTFLYTALAARAAGTRVVIHGEHGRETEDSRTTWGRQAAIRLLRPLVHHFSTVSRDIQETLVQEWGIPPERITLIPNGVDLSRFKTGSSGTALRDEIGVAAGSPLIGMVGGFRPVKDHATLLRAFAAVRRRVPEAKLALAGTDPTGTQMAGLLEMIRTLGIPTDAVLFLGTRDDVHRFMAAIDVYVNSSVYEGMSNTILEAMACGKPVVATAVGGTPDLVVDGVTGLLVPARAEDELAAGVLQLLEDPFKARAMGALGRARIEERHSFQRMVEDYETLYETLYARRVRRWRMLDKAKLWAGRGGEATGFTTAAGSLGRPVLTILAYHRVLPLPQKERTACQGMIVALDVFEQQMAALAARYRVLTLEDTLMHFRERRPFPKRSVLITFDDGYADNFTTAFPVLKRYGVSAVFFLTTGPIDSGEWLWWDDLAESLRVIHAYRPAELLAGLSAGTPDAIRRSVEAVSRSEDAGIARIDDLIRELNRVDEHARRRLVDGYRSRAQDLRGVERTRLMLTWEQVREMKAAGMHFGAHTVHHRFLDTLEETDGIAEVEGSMQRIADETGLMPVAFSYPKGRSNARVRGWVEKCGVEVAMTTETGVNDARSDPLALRRRDAGYLCIQDAYVGSHMTLEMSGLLDRTVLRRPPT